MRMFVSWVKREFHVRTHSLNQIQTQTQRDIQRLRDMILYGNGNVAVLTGAGISTDSGIPDYRGPKGVYMRNRAYKPIQYHEFAQQHAYRQRYWARSFLGWPKFSSSDPNASHDVLTKLQRKNLISHIITQNVDRLHTKSGARDVIELHGALHEVVCMDCQWFMTRNAFQLDLEERNPAVAAYLRRNKECGSIDVASSEQVNPDGDVEYVWDYDAFQYPSCPRCGSVMKPNVVFFGENVHKIVRQQSMEVIEKAEALIVIGSSLQVYSSLRLVQQAYKREIPIAILNMGPTRADALCELRLDMAASDVLTMIDSELQ